MPGWGGGPPQKTKSCIPLLPNLGLRFRKSINVFRNLSHGEPTYSKKLQQTHSGHVLVLYQRIYKSLQDFYNFHTNKPRGCCCHTETKTPHPINKGTTTSELLAESDQETFVCKQQDRHKQQGQNNIVPPRLPASNHGDSA